MNTNIEYDYQDIYEVINYPRAINYTWGTTPITYFKGYPELLF